MDLKLGELHPPNGFQFNFLLRDSATQEYDMGLCFKEF